MAAKDARACPNFSACKLKQGGSPRTGTFRAGRKPLPTKVKQIKGTLQKCRTNLREPKPQGDLVDPPDYMPEGAKAAWRYALECAPPTIGACGTRRTGSPVSGCTVSGSSLIFWTTSK